MPDGAISFPLAGVVSAYGQTVNGLQKLLTDKLARFISNPVVSITVLEVSGNKVYVVGQVKNPGEMIMNPPLDVLQALAKAGGLTPFADQNNIRIIRRNSDGTLFQLGFEYGSVLKGRSLDQNIMLNSGDLILVP